jgi:hypothetical protein
MRDLLIEASVLHQLLLALRDRVDTANAGGVWLTQVRLLATKDGPLDQFKSCLEHLVWQLGPPDRLRRALFWMLNKAEIEGVISKIERMKMLVSLALTNDHL